MSYIKELDKQIHSYLLQEFTNPQLCVPDLEQSAPEKWQDAWELWRGWLRICWRDVAIAHAGRQLSDSELASLYGLWDNRESEPGLTLLRIINKDKDRLATKFEKIAVRIGMLGG